MFDKLKFWKSSEPLHAPLDNDPMQQTMDPLQRLDPMQGMDPLQSNEPTPHVREQYPTGGVFSSLRLNQEPQEHVPEQYEPQAQYPAARDRDTELILAKLDAIKSEMDSLHQRVRKIEQHTEAQRRSW